MRYAIWAAVSTEAQAAADKVSLTEQQNKCREAARSRGWKEAAGPFVVPGESRTRWVNLRDAEQSLPPLHKMLETAQHGDYDVLMLYDYTRLRDLLDPVAKTLRAYNVQIFSVSQPVEPTEPDVFDGNDTAQIVEFTSGFVSKAEIAAIKRRYRLGMPKRIAIKGLTKGKIPYGYRKPPGRELDRNAVPIADPVTSHVVVRIRDEFMSGHTVREITKNLASDGILSPEGKRKWRGTTVMGILHNKFYSGRVYFGKRMRKADPRTGKVVTVFRPADKVVWGKGAHVPLWDEKMQMRLEAELARRACRPRVGGKAVRALSNILYCGRCGSRMWTSYDGGNLSNLNWACSAKENGSSHLRVRDDVLVPMVGERLKQAISDVGSVKFPSVEDRAQDTQKALEQLKAKRDRFTEAYGNGLLSLTDYSARVGELDVQIQAFERDLITGEKSAVENELRQEALRELSKIIDAIPSYVARAPAREVNANLRLILEKIIVRQDDVEIVLRR